MKTSEILQVDPKSPRPETIAVAAERIRHGGLVVFPTGSFYGLAANAFNAQAVARVFRMKARDSGKPILILIASPQDLVPLVRSIPPSAARLMKALWPGGITLVFDAASELPANLTGGTGKIGIRLPRHPVASALVKSVGAPITATSANVSGKAPCASVRDLDSRIKTGADLILDSGRLAAGTGSTVLDVSVCPPIVLREGPVRRDTITALLAP